MDLQKFDTTIKSALENFEVPYDPGTWAALENRLDKLPAPEAVDHAVRASMDKLETPYDAASWSTLLQRMDGVARARRVKAVKLAEAAILLLLLLNLEGFFGVVKSVANPEQKPAENISPQLPIASKNAAKKLSRCAESGLAMGNAEAKAGFSEQFSTLVHELAVDLNLTESGETLTAANDPQTIASNSSHLDPSNFYAQAGPVNFSSKNLPALPAKPVLYASALSFEPDFFMTPTPSKSRFYAAAYGSFDQNSFRDGGHTDKQHGYGAGFAVGYRKGKWGVEAGVTHSQKNYKPTRANVVYENDPFSGISMYYVDNVDAELVSVPVKVTRTVAKFGKTKALAVAGITTNFATSKRYGYKTVHYPPPIPVPTPNPNPSLSPAEIFPEAKGVFEQGNLTHNTYVSADLGIRVEHSLGKRYTAFVEPIYRQSLGGGLGPSGGRVNTLALQAGLMAAL